MGENVRRLLSALLTAAWALPASAEVTVLFPDSERDTDVRNTPRPSQMVLGAIERHLQWLGDRYLRPDEQLTIQVLDIDQAGQRYAFPLGVHDPDVRVVRDKADWPSMKLRYQLRVNDRVADSGEEWVSDMAFMRHPNRYPASEPLRYEKQMLDDWFAARIGKPRIGNPRAPARPGD